MRFEFRRIGFLAALVALVAFVAAGIVFAQTPPPPGQRMMQHAGRGQGGFLGHLNLTADQQTKIRTLFDQQREAHQADRQKMQDLRQQLKAAIFADSGPADTAAIQQQIQTLQDRLEADRINLEKQVAQVLTPDQRKQVRDMPGPGPFMGGRGRGAGMRHGAR